MINPYANINWSTVQRVPSVTHAHTPDGQVHFDALYNSGIRHFALSNYHPAKPWYPLTDFFENIPGNALGCPNAEHYGANNTNLHFCTIGSMYEASGIKTTWQNGFLNAFSQMTVYGRGGLITINHPVWSGLATDTVIRMLDYEESAKHYLGRNVLGIEVFNHSSEVDNETGWALDMWDEILLTGRKCWGFFVPDHQHRTNPNWQGRNILLPTSYSESACLNAYLDGRFYGSLNGNLKFNSITLSGNTLNVTVDQPATIKTIVDGTVIKTTEGTNDTVNIPAGAIYCRTEAENENDKIFSQPIIFKEYKKQKKVQNLVHLM